MREHKLTVEAEPYEFELDPKRTALLLIDMQRDFVEPGGFGEQLGNDVSNLRRVIAPLQRVLGVMRECGYTVIHTREGQDRKSTRLNSSHLGISYAVFCLKKKK